MNSNDSYLKETGKISEFIALKILLPVIALLYLVFSSTLVIVVTLILTPLLYVLIFKKLQFNKKLFHVSICVYLITVSIFSCLPKIQYESFKLFHPNWVEVKGTITNYKVNWVTTTKHTAASSKADITYAYNFKDKDYKINKTRTLSFYSNNVWNSEKDKTKYIHKLSKQLESDVKHNNYKILVNQEAESKLFIPLNNFSYHTSFPLTFITIILKIIITIALLCSIPFLLAYIVSYFKN